MQYAYSIHFLCKSSKRNHLFLSIGNKVIIIISSKTAMIYIQNMLEIMCILRAFFSWILCWIFPFPARKALHFLVQFIRICEINMGNKVTMWFNEFLNICPGWSSNQKWSEISKMVIKKCFDILDRVVVAFDFCQLSINQNGK